MNVLLVENVRPNIRKNHKSAETPSTFVYDIQQIPVGHGRLMELLQTLSKKTIWE